MPSWVLKYVLIIIARNRKMKTLKYVSLMFIAFVFILGCSGNYGKLKPQSESDSKVTQRELIDNWSDYNIWPGYFKWFGGGPGGAWLSLAERAPNR